MEMTPEHMEALLAGGCEIDKFLTIYTIPHNDGKQEARILHWPDREHIVFRTFDGDTVTVKHRDWVNRFTLPPVNRVIEKQGTLW